MKKDLLFLLDNLEFSFFVGFYLGIFTVDIWRSFHLAERLRKFVNGTGEKWEIDFEKFKLELRDKIKHKFISGARFILPFHGELGYTLPENLKNHKSNLTKTYKATKNTK